uniref:Multiple epidermal growth factor-like domains protein 10 n=1 Tax=Crassostrea virginica TaxID=6565 RepID=A0A8B8AWZ3_CRAVI|nr:multiple epidermal growth factor-like domains protein 10 [Crassostrea virginica]
MKVLYILCVIFILGNSEKCESPNGIVCCEGFKKRDQIGDDCIPCEIGFHGANCVVPCYYPSYGKNCQSRCSCVEEFCDYVDGCKDIKDLDTTSFISSTTSSFRKFYEHVMHKQFFLHNI